MSIQLMALLTFHLFCNAVAATGPLSRSEAHACSANFEELKVLLTPDLTMAEFEGLAPTERARVSIATYDHYRAWIADNAALFEHLSAQAAVNVRVAGF